MIDRKVEIHKNAQKCIAYWMKNKVPVGDEIDKIIREKIEL